MSSIVKSRPTSAFKTFRSAVERPACGDRRGDSFAEVRDDFAFSDRRWLAVTFREIGARTFNVGDDRAG